MDALRSYLLTVLANGLWQTALVAGVAALCAWAARRAPARHRYAIWVVALAASALLPLVGAWRAVSVSSAASLEGIGGTAAVGTANGGGAGAVAWLGAGGVADSSVSVGSFVGWIALGCYAVLVLAGIARFARSWRATRTLRASAVACRLPESIDEVAERCCRELGLETTPVLVSWSVAVPSTVGAIRPVVILPAALLAERDPDVLATALGHELAHVRRRDYAVHLACELLAIPFAFHPAVALVRRKIRLARELACDERVTERLLAGRSYARSLLEMARTAPAASPAGHTLGVLDADILEERVMHLIDQRPRASARTGRLFVFAALLALGATGALAVSHSVAVSAAQAPERALVGQWSLYIWNDGEAKSPEGEDGLPALLAIDFDGTKLTGTATVWPVRRTENGKVVGDDSKKTVMPLVDPTFDGKTFAFKVFNGEENLLGELVYDGRAYVGRWASSKSKLAGTLKMVRR